MTAPQLTDHMNTTHGVQLEEFDILNFQQRRGAKARGETDAK